MLKTSSGFPCMQRSLVPEPKFMHKRRKPRGPTGQSVTVKGDLAMLEQISNKVTSVDRKKISKVSQMSRYGTINPERLRALNHSAATMKSPSKTSRHHMRKIDSFDTQTDFTNVALSPRILAKAGESGQFQSSVDHITVNDQL